MRGPAIAKQACSPMRSLFITLVLLLASPAWAARAIVVLGAHLESNGTPSVALDARLKRALLLAKADPASKVLVSGGSGGAWGKEAPVMARWLEARGVSRKRILVEDHSRHTGENADLSVPLLRDAGIDEVTVVTSRYHLPRARFHVRWALRAAGLGHVRVDGEGAEDDLHGLRRFVTAVRERLKIARDLRWRLGRRMNRVE
jgi:uncharacterized SAM-binding protein YcdF (DUF218 family)